MNNRQKLNEQHRPLAQFCGCYDCSKKRLDKEVSQIESPAESAPAPPSANFLQRLGGTCFAHGEYGQEGCPKWPACATDQQIYKPVAAPQVAKIIETLGFDPTNHHNAAKCPYCNPDGALIPKAEYVSMREKLEARLNWISSELSEIGVDEHMSKSGGSESRTLVNHRADVAESSLAGMRTALETRQRLIHNAQNHQWSDWRKCDQPGCVEVHKLATS